MFPAQSEHGSPRMHCEKGEIMFKLILHYYSETVLLSFQICTTDMLIFEQR